MVFQFQLSVQIEFASFAICTFSWEWNIVKTNCFYLFFYYFIYYVNNWEICKMFFYLVRLAGFVVVDVRLRVVKSVALVDICGQCYKLVTFLE